MALDRYIKMEEVERAVEGLVKEMLFPALDRVVADSSNPYDDAALNLAKPMLLAAIDKIADDGE